MLRLLIVAALANFASALPTTEAQASKAKAWWRAASPQARCDSCKMMVDNAMLMMERRFQVQRKEQKVEGTGTLPPWGDTKLSLEFHYFQEKMCVRGAYDKYVRRHVHVLELI